jgi:hypothetical protein
VTTYHELDAAWWRWAASQSHGGAKGRALDRLADVAFPFDGTDWTVQREQGPSKRIVSIYVGADGRVLAPLKHRASEADETPDDGPA